MGQNESRTEISEDSAEGKVTLLEPLCLNGTSGITKDGMLMKYGPPSLIHRGHEKIPLGTLHPEESLSSGVIESSRSITNSHPFEERLEWYQTAHGVSLVAYFQGNKVTQIFPSSLRITLCTAWFDYIKTHQN